MRTRGVVALVAGFAVAVAVAGFPAAASDTTIAAGVSSWNPSSATITAGESVKWTNSGGIHNVCVQKPGASGDTCDEFTNGAPSDAWSEASHPFTTPGTYNFFCANHKAYGMTGTITDTSTSTGTGTGTGTSTTPPPDTMPTDTTTIQDPTQIEQNSVVDDKTAPGFVGKPKRRASRKSLVVELRSSEAATLKATVFRRPPRGRSFSRISEASLQVKPGKNVVKLPRKAGGSLRSGAYRVKLQLVDAAGNKSPAKTLVFKLAS
jgi:plastocyanin